MNHEPGDVYPASCEAGCQVHKSQLANRPMTENIPKNDPEIPVADLIDPSWVNDRQIRVLSELMRTRGWSSTRFLKEVSDMVARQLLYIDEKNSQEA